MSTKAPHNIKPPWGQQGAKSRPTFSKTPKKKNFWPKKKVYFEFWDIYEVHKKIS